MKLPQSWTTVTLLSKILAIILFISLPFIGFYFGVKYKKVTQVNQSNNFIDVQKPGVVNEEFSIKKSSGNTNYPGSYKYELWKSNTTGNRVVYSIDNWFGFKYDVSEDKKYIAILNYGESMGDETLIIIHNDGQVVKDFGRLDAQNTLVPFNWTEHFYWLSEGIPTMDKPLGVIRVDADTFKIERFVNKDLGNLQ